MFHKITVLFLWASLQINAQIDASENSTGTIHTIESQALNETREIQVYLPPTYESSVESYPVVYVLDGQRLFHYAVSLNQSFRQFELTPNFIVVGVDTNYPKRFQQLGEGKENFIQFLKEELLPYINNRYRTNEEDLLFGWEYGGSLVYNIMLTHPAVFDSHLIASPYPIMDKIDDLAIHKNLKTHLYFSVSPDEYDVRHSTEKLDSLLNTNPIEGLDWHYLKLDLEEHRSTAFPTLYHGLRSYFALYQEFETNNLQKFLNAGGLAYAREYAKQRAIRYGFPAELSHWSKYTIIRSAIRANDFDHFESLLQELDKTVLVQDLLQNDMDFAVSSLAQFYTENHRQQEAIALLDRLLEKHPDSDRLLERKKNALVALNKKTKE